MAILVLAGCNAGTGGPSGTGGISGTGRPSGTGGLGGTVRPVGTGGTGVASNLSPACASFYAELPAFALSTTRDVDVIADLAKPDKGTAFAEPVYGTCETRATDHATDGISDFARNDYSRRQAFNADSTQHIVSSGNGFWHLYDARTHAYVKVLSGLAGDAEPQWHPTDPTSSTTCRQMAWG